MGDASLRRSRRSSAVKKGVKYDIDNKLFSDDDNDDEQQALLRRELPCMSTGSTELETSLVVDCFVGRRVNCKSCRDIEFRVKFTNRSHLHLLWLNFEKIQELIGTGTRDRIRIQSYERKLKREGYETLEDVDDLNISSVTLDCIISHKRARLPTLEEGLSRWHYHN
jgi:hypothetical protein